MKKVSMLGMAFAIALTSGCVTVPMADKGSHEFVMSFPAPPEGKAGVYVFRTGGVGDGLKKDIWIDGECLGETASKVFFYTTVDGDREHTFSTESEFSPNHIKLTLEAGRTYFIRQVLRWGVFVWGATLKVVPEAEGRQQVAALQLAKMGNCWLPDGSGQ